MRLKSDLRLRKIGKRYMVVSVDSAVNLANVYTLNATAARLWQYCEGGECDPESMARFLCDEYEVDMETALHDVEQQLAEWKEFGLIEE